MTIQVQKPAIELITLRDQLIYSAEMRCVITKHDIKSFCKELLVNFIERQEEFKSIELFKEYPLLIAEILFHPELMIKRIMLLVIQQIGQYKTTDDSKFCIRIGMVVAITADNDTQCVVSVAIEEINHPRAWLRPAVVVESFMTPDLVEGLDVISNDHHVTQCYSFTFEIEPIVPVLYKDIPDESGIIDRSIVFFTKQEMVDYYMKFCDELMKPSLIYQYQNWIGNQHVPVIISKDDIEKQWPSYREKIYQHLVSEFDEVEEMYTKTPSVVPRGFLSIIIHPPDITNHDQHPFLILEFVKTIGPDRKQPLIATTIDTTGPIISPNKIVHQYLSSTTIQ